MQRCEHQAMVSPERDVVPRPAQPLTDLDFHSGARIAELNQLVQELSKQTMWDPGVRAAPELLTLKDFVFSLLGLVHKVDKKLPEANEYLLLSGGARQGTVDLDPGVLGCYTSRANYDADYTLLVPVLQTHGCPIALDLHRCPPGYAWLPLAPFGPEAWHRWADCCQHHDGQAYLAPSLVSAWFCQTLVAVTSQAQATPQQGEPTVEWVVGQGGLVTLMLRHGTLRALYDVVPVVAFQGWPAVAQDWLSHSHFWEGKLMEEDVAEGFYLLPSSCPAWRDYPDQGRTTLTKDYLLTWQESLGPVEAPGLVETVGKAWHEAQNLVDVVGLTWHEVSGSGEAVDSVKAIGPTCHEAQDPVDASGLAWHDTLDPVEAMSQLEALGPAEAVGPAWREAQDAAEATGLAWRLSFSRSELHLKQVVPPPLLQAFRAARAALSCTWNKKVGPYHLWTLVLWACDRLPARYLGQEENAAHCLLGLLDDMVSSLARASCPHYFLPSCNRLEGVWEPGLARTVAGGPGGPARPFGLPGLPCPAPGTRRSVRITSGPWCCGPVTACLHATWARRKTQPIAC
uniref:Transmembrane protein 102 n=1 Tax=Pelodiscus sinensis TaxID=13735 RepID=K7FU96_PELSI|nr:transmembrane protein 102 [Pelodiscus sinensis]|eukprot:XP_025044175.1 transmembrane protein 102 [Pelodiscus sinensis]